MNILYLNITFGYLSIMEYLVGFSVLIELLVRIEPSIEDIKKIVGLD